MFAVNPGVLAAGVTTGPVGQALFTSSGSFVVPAGVTSICVVAISRGGRSSNNGSRWWSGGGGGLAYWNAIPVTPGETLDALVQTTSSGEVRLNRGATKLCAAQNGNEDVAGYGTVGDVLRSGGSGASASAIGNLPGAGAAGYTANGQSAVGISGSRGGGGMSPLGGTTGALANIAPSESGLLYGGGSGSLGGSQSPGAGGCVRIIWGEGRAFPNINTGDL